MPNAINMATMMTPTNMDCRKPANCRRVAGTISTMNSSGIQSDAHTAYTSGVL